MGSSAYNRWRNSSRSGVFSAKHLWVELHDALIQRVRDGRIDWIQLVEPASARQWSACGSNTNKKSSLRLQRSEEFPQVSARRPGRLGELVRRFGDDGEKGSKGKRGVPGELMEKAPSRKVVNDEDAARALGGNIAGWAAKAASSSEDGGGASGGGDRLVESSITGQ